MKRVQTATFENPPDPAGKLIERVVAEIDEAHRRRARANSAGMRRYWLSKAQLALERYNELLRGEPSSVETMPILWLLKP